MKELEKQYMDYLEQLAAEIREVPANISGAVSKNVTKKPGHLYVSALNWKNADKKFFKILGLKYPKRLALIACLFLGLALTTCTTEKWIQVELQVWTLIDKKEASRLIKGEWVYSYWLTWENADKDRFCEFTKPGQRTYEVGSVIYNRVVR